MSVYMLCAYVKIHIVYITTLLKLSNRFCMCVSVWVCRFILYVSAWVLVSVCVSTLCHGNVMAEMSQFLLLFCQQTTPGKGSPSGPLSAG